MTGCIVNGNAADLGASCLRLEVRSSAGESVGRLALSMPAHERGLPTAADEQRTAEATTILESLQSRLLGDILESARCLARSVHGETISYSRKVFIPLTRLCRDSCAYCTFATVPSKVRRAFLTPIEVLEIARSGEVAGCREALFTLGDKPELRYAQAREELEEMGYATTVDYLVAMCELVLRETSLLPHVNAGVMPESDILRLRSVSVSQGLMLESASDRLCHRGGPHFGSPDKAPRLRLSMIEAAGRLAVPFTTGILIGIGETRLERVEALLAIKELHMRHGHVQEVIVQNFRAKADTRMAGCDEPDLEDLLWTAAVARLVLGGAMNIQVPPNLSDVAYPALLSAGINDWGGVSPVTPDFVNPEAVWPAIDTLASATRRGGYELVERLGVYPQYCNDARHWLAPEIAIKVRRQCDASGYPRTDEWYAGTSAQLPSEMLMRKSPERGEAEHLGSLLARAQDGDLLDESEIASLFSARGDAFHAVCEAADELRRSAVGDDVGYVVNRNINYTNICLHGCKFCAFAKGRGAEDLRGVPYDLSQEEVARRATEAWQRGATEVCLQGGIHPAYTGNTYIEICRTVKQAQPGLHIHAFSPLEILNGAGTLNLGLREYLIRLRDAGLSTLPGTAAEILDDEVRAQICPDKLNTAEWLQVMEAAHEVGLRTTATIMFGHVERPIHWARHLLRIRSLQARTGGFTEFVPLPYIHMEAPMYRRGLSRRGPTFREAVLMHAVARLVFNPVLVNIQASWVKLGVDGAARCLQAGANDLGGTLMNESISRAAGTAHGQELAPKDIEAALRAIGRRPRQRTTLYANASNERVEASWDAAPLKEVILTPPTWRRKSSSVALKV